MRLKSLLLATLFLISPLATAQIQYHGFTIDSSLLDSEQKARYYATALPALITQIDIVESVGLPPHMLELFKRTKIVLDPDFHKSMGRFSSRDGRTMVTLQTVAIPAEKPTLLHEFLHAYHYSIGRTPEIAEAFREASTPGVYPPNYLRAHFMEKQQEFFAVTGSIYLFGPVHQPPFNCAGFAKNHPAYMAFLEKTFGPRECK